MTRSGNWAFFRCSKNKNGHRHKVGGQDDSTREGTPWTGHPMDGLQTASTSQWNHIQCNIMSDVTIDANNITQKITNQEM